MTFDAGNNEGTTFYGLYLFHGSFWQSRHGDQFNQTTAILQKTKGTKKSLKITYVTRDSDSIAIGNRGP